MRRTRGRLTIPMNTERTYAAIDLKSFYASVECVARGLDPLTTNLVVADASRTEKTICLAVSPALKALGIGGRPRLFEVVQRVREVNLERRRLAHGRQRGKSTDANELREHPDRAVDYIVAPPRMAHYIEVSAQVYATYLKSVAPDDIFAYSVDEVFIDLTPYLRDGRESAHDFVMGMVRNVLRQTGITATAGIGSNMYLAKIAMDIVAKKMAPDADGVRIAALDEADYRRRLWDHRPLTDFWRVGRGIAGRLAPYGIDTMGKLARLSLEHEDFLYNLFGINAELLIDHAWGWEPCTLADAKAYKPETKSISSGQVLSRPYTFDMARIVAREMADVAALKLVREGLATDQLVLTVGYDAESLRNQGESGGYEGEIHRDHYGRAVPKHAHGTANLGAHTNSAARIMEAVESLFDRIVNPDLLVRRINLTQNHILPEAEAERPAAPEQLDLFVDYDALRAAQRREEQALSKERRLQEARLAIMQRFGKNSILKGLNFAEGATTKERNGQIGGHKA